MMADINIEQSRAFYDSYYQKKKQIQRTYSAILKYFKEPGKLLDVACGDGQFLASLPDDIIKYGIDISPEALRIALHNLHTNLSNAYLEPAPAEDIPFPDNLFDYVTCFGSIEHFVDMEKGLREMARVGKSYCKYFFAVPNSKFNIVSLTKGKVGTEQALNIEVLHSLKEWQKIFEDSGYQVIDVHNFPVYRKSWTWLKRIVYWFLPLRFDEQFMFMCKKTQC